MTTLTLPEFKERALLSWESDSEICKPSGNSPFLVLTADESFWGKLRSLATGTRKLVRRRSPGDSRRALRLFKPDAVLLDLDIPAPSVWDTADSLLLDAGSPPVLLLTSRSGQIDFKTAIEAGSLIDKRTDPAELLTLIEAARDLSDRACRERNAMQQLVIRWLKPFISPAPQTPSHNRFWGIND